MLLKVLGVSLCVALGVSCTPTVGEGEASSGLSAAAVALDQAKVEQYQLSEAYLTFNASGTNYPGCYQPNTDGRYVSKNGEKREFYAKVSGATLIFSNDQCGHGLKTSDSYSGANLVLVDTSHGRLFEGSIDTVISFTSSSELRFKLTCIDPNKCPNDETVAEGNWGGDKKQVVDNFSVKVDIDPKLDKSIVDSRECLKLLKGRNYVDNQGVKVDELHQNSVCVRPQNNTVTDCDKLRSAYGACFLNQNTIRPIPDCSEFASLCRNVGIIQ
jgi:hypothetical protein